MIQVILSSEQYVLHSELETDQDGNGHLLTGSWPAAGAKVGLLELPPRINVTVDRAKQELSISFLNESRPAFQLPRTCGAGKILVALVPIPQSSYK